MVARQTIHQLRLSASRKNPMDIPLSVLNQIMIPDGWQNEAIQGLKAGRDVILDAPTGAGKTFVLEQFIESSRGTAQIFYTAPTRALANDKYAEWSSRNWRVGLCTGDVRIQLDAPVLVGTLEALRGRVAPAAVAGSVFAEASPDKCELRVAGSPSLLVVDEYQWLADGARGNHYEGVLMEAPASTQLLLMSGSVRNVEDVAAWLRRLEREPVLVRHHERPVPLEEVDAGTLKRRAPDKMEGFWSQVIAGALMEDLGPILVFAPHRKDAEKLARQLAGRLPLPQPLRLSAEQERVAGKTLAGFLEKRVAYHHSGLSWQQRAGLIEPLAKAGQLRVVVSTLGLSSGINFSLRSVLITARSYTAGGLDHRLQPDEIMQMAGRAGRRGKDSVGYLIFADSSPRLAEAHAVKIKRSDALPWSVLLNQIMRQEDTRQAALSFSRGLFTEEGIPMGCESDPGLQPEELPCRRLLDTSRARLVRNTRRPFKACKSCERREECLELSPDPTLLWQWQRIGLLDHELAVTTRGRVVAQFLGPEGLALAAALESKSYPPDELVYDLADCYAGERFAGSEPRWSGRLALACQKAYGRFSIEGYLTWGVPSHYGIGGGQVLRELLEGEQRKARLGGEHAGSGDIDRLLTEWTGLLRQVVQSGPELVKSIGQDRVAESLSGLIPVVQQLLRQFPETSLPELPEITAGQKKPVSHRLHWKEFR
jgi:superfamily II DNA/RNA helicase